MMPPTFDALQDVEQFMGRHRSDRTVCDGGKEFEKPARLLEGGGRLSLALHLLDIFLGHQPESGLRREFGLQPALTLFLYRIDPVDELRACLVTLSPRLLKRHVWKGTERQLPFVAQDFVAKSPKEHPGRLNDQKEPVSVWNLERAR